MVCLFLGSPLVFCVGGASLEFHSENFWGSKTTCVPKVYTLIWEWEGIHNLKNKQNTKICEEQLKIGEFLLCEVTSVWIVVDPTKRDLIHILLGRCPQDPWDKCSRVMSRKLGPLLALQKFSWPQVCHWRNKAKFLQGSERTKNAAGQPEYIDEDEMGWHTSVQVLLWSCDIENQIKLSPSQSPKDVHYKHPLSLDIICHLMKTEKFMENVSFPTSRYVTTGGS